MSAPRSGVLAAGTFVVDRVVLIDRYPAENTLASIAEWAADLGFTAVQIPSSDPRFIDLQKAADSTSYCDEIKGILNERGLEITELSSHLQGQGIS